MKKLLFLLLLASPCMAGTITDFFGTGGGTITISSGTVVGGGGGGGTGLILDSTTIQNTRGTAGDNSMTLTIGACSNRMLVVGCAGDVVAYSAATVGGVALTLSTGSVSAISSTWIFTKVNPTSGSQTIAIAWLNGTQKSCGAVSYCGASSVVDFSTATYNYDAGSTSKSTLTTSVSGDVLFDAVVGEDSGNTLVPGAGQGALLTNTSYNLGISTKSVAAAGSYNMTWSNLAGNPHQTSAIAIKPAP